MITNPSICPCGKKFFPTPTRKDRCRTCALDIRRKAVKQKPVEAFGEVIDDEEVAGQPHYIPTPEEIAATCAEIRKSWDRHRWASQPGVPGPVEVHTARIEEE